VALVLVLLEAHRAQYGRVSAPFVYTEPEIAVVLRVPPEAVRAWLRRGDLRPIALTSDGRSLFAAGDVDAIGKRLAAAENVRVLLRRPPGPFERLAALAGGGPVLMATARFGRSPVRDEAYRLRTRRRDLDLKLSWRAFTSLADWGKRWPAEQEASPDSALDNGITSCR
jgi:hypothetical protein